MVQRKRESEVYMLCWLHAQSWDIPVRRPASVCVTVSKLSANCCDTIKVARDAKHEEQLGIQVCSHDYASSL